MFNGGINNVLLPFYAWVLCEILLTIFVPEGATGKAEGSIVWAVGILQTLAATVILFIVALIRRLPLSFLRTLSVVGTLVNSILIFTLSYYTAITVGPGPEFGDWSMGLFLFPVMGISVVSFVMVFAAIVYGIIVAFRKVLKGD